MRALMFVLSLLISFSQFSCGNRQAEERILTGEMDDKLLVVADADISPADLLSTAGIDRKTIMEGSLTFETKDPEATRAMIEANTRNLKGYIAGENDWSYDDRIQHNLEIRVPAENFNLLVSRISEHVNKFDNKNISSQDVTEEFIDISARITTKKELEKRYLELLKKAVRVEEILSIEKELGTLRADIESIEGRLRYLNERISFSKLSVSFYQKVSSPFRFSTRFGDSLKNGWRNLMWFFIGLVNLWPFLLIGIVLMFFLLRFRKRRKVKKMQ